jgi:hypothetical protein
MTSSTIFFLVNGMQRNDYLFQAPRKEIFRVILMECEIFGDGRSEFIFNLIKTLEPLRGGDPNPTLIASAIVLATQFRSLFIENDATYSIGALEGEPEEKLVSDTKHILRDLRRIDMEAAALGLTKEALKAALGLPEEIKAWFENCSPLVENLEVAAHAYIAARTEPNKTTLLSAHREMIEQTSTVYWPFTSLCLQRFKQIIDGSA